MWTIVVQKEKETKLFLILALNTYALTEHTKRNVVEENSGKVWVNATKISQARRIRINGNNV